MSAVTASAYLTVCRVVFVRVLLAGIFGMLPGSFSGKRKLQTDHGRTLVVRQVVLVVRQVTLVVRQVELVARQALPAYIIFAFSFPLLSLNSFSL